MTAANNRILLVEDDRNFGDVLRSYLEMHDYDVTLATDGEAGLESYNKGQYDLCIFDVMMPKKDGFTLAKEIREKDTEMPIIFLTAKTMKDDVLKGFKIGADDYITKPFNSEELLYRIQAILKRSQAKDDPSEDSKNKLSPKEAQLLRMFCMYKNDILPRSEALTKIWSEDNYFTARSMDVFVTKLRKYLAPDPNIEIVNIHGNGFQLLIRNNEENS
jgi:two-component system OmpR family response regulator